MSIEFQLAWPCPHLTVEEVVPLGDDRRSLDTLQPIAAAGQVRILANDEFFIPREGVFSAAILSSSLSGPFDIVPNDDTWVVETSGGTETLTFGVTTLARLSTDQVVQRTRIAGWRHVEVRNENGYLVLVDPNRVGPSAFVKVSGSAAGSLGFGQPCSPTTGSRSRGGSGYQRAAYGRQVYPGWDLYQRPDTITNRYPRFRAKLKTNPMLKVTYSVPVQRCRRCQATFVENDYRFDQHGHMIAIQNEDLLYQAALKILLTDRGSNPFFPWYGTTIRERIGSKALAGVASVLSEDVRQGLANVQALQTEQAKYQPVTYKERLYAVLNVDVKRHVQDPTTYMIDVTVQNASGQPVTLNIVFTVPEVVALMGTNGLMLGTEAAGLGTEQVWDIFKNDRNLLTGGQ
jgi:phage baseplate assembly protein W